MTLVNCTCDLDHIPKTSLNIPPLLAGWSVRIYREMDDDNQRPLLCPCGSYKTLSQPERRLRASQHTASGVDPNSHRLQLSSTQVAAGVEPLKKTVGIDANA